MCGSHDDRPGGSRGRIVVIIFDCHFRSRVDATFFGAHVILHDLTGKLIRFMHTGMIKSVPADTKDTNEIMLDKKAIYCWVKIMILGGI